MSDRKVTEMTCAYCITRYPWDREHFPDQTVAMCKNCLARVLEAESMTDRKVTVNWEQIARTLRDHYRMGDGLCAACGCDWNCPDWTRASEAIGE